jgi:hypothetical protein
MKTLRTSLALGSVLAAALFGFPAFAAAQATVLQAPDAAKLLPDAVYFDAKSASTQLRNSGAVHFSDGPYTLAVLVDTSGYSTAVQQKYQGYLLTETALDFGGNRLPAGAYGFGFVGGQFLVMDIGAHDLFRAPAAHDAELPHPMPLKILAGSSSSEWKLCSGRDCVTFRRAH